MEDSDSLIESLQYRFEFYQQTNILLSTDEYNLFSEIGEGELDDDKKNFLDESRKFIGRELAGELEALEEVEKAKAELVSTNEKLEQALFDSQKDVIQQQEMRLALQEQESSSRQSYVVVLSIPLIIVFGMIGIFWLSLIDSNPLLIDSLRDVVLIAMGSLGSVVTHMFGRERTKGGK